MKIVKFPHPALMTKSKDVIDFDDNLRLNVLKMISLMEEANGVGLAANQVALNCRIVVMKCNEKPTYIIINPQIINVSSELVVSNERCLSFENLSLEIERPSWIDITWKNEIGEIKQETFYGLEAVCIQHETDHLDGINFIEYLGNVKKQFALKSYFKKKK